MTTDVMLKLDRFINAPRERVFAAWTDPSIFPKWFGPKGVHIPEFELDVRPGGAWRAVMENAEGQRYYVGGAYEEIVENEKLVFTWAWTHDGVRGHESRITLRFADDGQGARLSIVHENLESDESAENHNGGWTSSLDCLEALLTA